ncbi:MAG: RDD family protein [Chloroflexota bacterium]|nr:MAG: RDD family protein [Chloroflexota bacterium]
MDFAAPVSRKNRPAGFISRLEAFIADIIVLTTGGVFATWLFELIFRFFSLNIIFGNLRSTQYSPFIFSLVILVYFIYFWSLLGYTPGKYLLGLKVVRRDGSKLSLGRAFIRLIGYWVSAIPLFFGFIWIIFDHRRQGWHDKLADTQVIYTQGDRTRE